MIELKYIIDITPGENSKEVKTLESYGFTRNWDREMKNFEGLSYFERSILNVTISNYDEHRERAELTIQLFKYSGIDEAFRIIYILKEAGITIWDIGDTDVKIDGGLELC